MNVSQLTMSCIKLLIFFNNMTIFATWSGRSLFTLVVSRTSGGLAAAELASQHPNSSWVMGPCWVPVWLPLSRQTIDSRVRWWRPTPTSRTPWCCSVTRQTCSCSSDYRAKVANARGQLGADRLAARQLGASGARRPPRRHQTSEFPNVRVCDTAGATASTRLARGPDSCPCCVLSCPEHPLTSNQRLISHNVRGKSEPTSSSRVG